MYDKRWAIRTLEEFVKLHPRAEEFLFRGWSVYNRTNEPPEVKSYSEVIQRLIRALTMMDGMKAFQNLWEDFKAMTKLFEGGDLAAPHRFAGLYGPYLFKMWRQGTLISTKQAFSIAEGA